MVTKTQKKSTTKKSAVKGKKLKTTTAKTGNADSAKGAGKKSKTRSASTEKRIASKTAASQGRKKTSTTATATTGNKRKTTAAASKKVTVEKRKVSGKASNKPAKTSPGAKAALSLEEKSENESSKATVVPKFEIGDRVVYPAHGVGAIDAIESRKIGPIVQQFYKLTIVETGMKIMIPVNQVNTVGLRKVVNSSTVDEVYDILRDKNVEIDTQTWNRRYRDYTQKIKTGSVHEIAKVIRDLSVLKSDKELSFGERKMLDTAQGLLVKEISIAVSRSEDTVKAELQEMFFHS